MPKKKTKSPPILSHEFVIQNHADIVSGILCVCLVGFFFEVSLLNCVLFFKLTEIFCSNFIY